ncbi:MAG: type II secretion system protein M [Deltaproteobacteria bacterium]|nr:MAG: type II secretion system protein M [Deltaproteobacteria bacterium]
MLNIKFKILILKLKVYIKPITQMAKKVISNIKETLSSIRESITEKSTGIYQRLGFSKLNKREKAILGGGSLLLLIILIYIIIISPFSRRIARLDELIETKKKEYGEMMKMKEKYLRVQERVKNIKPMPPKFSLLSHLENLARQSNVKIDSVKPGPTGESGPFKETITDVKIERITLDQLVEFLYKIEISGEYPLKVKKIHIKPTYKNPQYLEVSFQIVSLQPA